MPNSNRGLHTGTCTTSTTNGHTGHPEALSCKSKRQSLEIKLRYNNDEHKYEVVDSPCPTKYDEVSHEYQMQLPSGKILVVKQPSSRRNSNASMSTSQFTGIEETENENSPTVPSPKPPTPVRQANPPTPNRHTLVQKH